MIKKTNKIDECLNSKILKPGISEEWICLRCGWQGLEAELIEVEVQTGYDLGYLCPDCKKCLKRSRGDRV